MMNNLLYAAMVDNQAERNHWLKIKDYSDQISLLTTFALERRLTPWEEQRTKELIILLFNESKADNSIRTYLDYSRTTYRTPVVPPTPTTSTVVSPEAMLPEINSVLHNLRQNLWSNSSSKAPDTAAASRPDESSESGDGCFVPPKRKRGRKSIDKSALCCSACKTSVTPEWRKGPKGRNSLCNACGLRWSKVAKPDQSSSPGESSQSSSPTSPSTLNTDDLTKDPKSITTTEPIRSDSPTNIPPGTSANSTTRTNATNSASIPNLERVEKTIQSTPNVTEVEAPVTLVT